MKTITKFACFIIFAISLLSCNASSDESIETTDSGLGEVSTPTANAGIDRVVKLATEIVLDGSQSSDPDGKSLSYKWRITSKPDGSEIDLKLDNSANPSFTPNTKGSFVFTLEVSNGTKTDNDSVKIIANDQEDLKPTLLLESFGENQYQVVLLSPDEYQSVGLVGVQNIGIKCIGFSDLIGLNLYSPAAKGFNDFQSISFSDLDGKRKNAGMNLHLYSFKCSQPPEFKPGNSASITYDNLAPVVGKENIQFLD